MKLYSPTLQKEEMSEGENLITKRFLICYIVHCNAQRKEAVVNLTLGRAVELQMGIQGKFKSYAA